MAAFHPMPGPLSNPSPEGPPPTLPAGLFWAAWGLGPATFVTVLAPACWLLRRGGYWHDWPDLYCLYGVLFAVWAHGLGAVLLFPLLLERSNQRREPRTWLLLGYWLLLVGWICFGLGAPWAGERPSFAAFEVTTALTALLGMVAPFARRRR